MNTELIKSADDAIIVLEFGGASKARLLEAMNFVDALKEVTRSLSERLEAAAIAWIEQNGEIESGEIRYYVGPNKTTKCLDLKATVEAVLTATGGDTDAFVRTLSTSAFKHGACREVLPPEDYAALFKTTETPDLKTGVASKRLQKVNERFLK